MDAFILIAVAGFFGMLLLAIPGMGRHGHSHSSSSGVHASHTISPSVRASKSVTRLAQPRVLFSLLALFGVFGGVIAWNGITPVIAGLIAFIPAVLIERFVIDKFWNFLLQFQGEPDSPLTNLTMQFATAVTEFHNGKGIVEVLRDGRSVQLTAHLTSQQMDTSVRVGDRLQIEEVDESHERVLVSIRT